MLYYIYWKLKVVVTKKRPKIPVLIENYNFKSKVGLGSYSFKIMFVFKISMTNMSELAAPGSEISNQFLGELLKLKNSYQYTELI